jgi:hypothetical protein
MNNVLNFTLRPSDVVLDRVYNPSRSADFGDATPSQLAEACGLIPDFFAAACLRPLIKLTLDNVADGMDDAYQYGGFSAYPCPGSITDFGIYQSDDGDDDIPPLVRFIFAGFELFVYCHSVTWSDEYVIAAIRDRATRQTKIARFD